MGTVPEVKDISEFFKPAFQVGEIVYLTAFLKEERGVFYICKGEVLEVPGIDDRPVFTVKIISVGDRPIGGNPVQKQAQLLGLICTKKIRELNSSLPSFMMPPNWIDSNPQDKFYGKNSRKK